MEDLKIKARLGRKQEKVILDDKNHGHEVCVFNERYKHLAPLVVKFLNNYSKKALDYNKIKL